MLRQIVACSYPGIKLYAALNSSLLLKYAFSTRFECPLYFHTRAYIIRLPERQAATAASGDVRARRKGITNITIVAAAVYV